MECWNVYPCGPQPKRKRHTLLADAMYCEGCQPDYPTGNWKEMFGIVPRKVSEEEECDKWGPCTKKKGHRGRHKGKKYPRKRKREEEDVPTPAAAPLPALDQVRDVILDALKEVPVPTIVSRAAFREYRRWQQGMGTFPSMSNEVLGEIMENYGKWVTLYR